MAQAPCSKFDAWGSWVVRLTMGDYVDYFKPSAGSDLCGMLTSNSNHLWSGGWRGTFVTPTYSATGYGGSIHNPNPDSADTRTALPFWSHTLPGGRGVSSFGGAIASGQPFTMHVRPDVYIPEGIRTCGAGAVARCPVFPCRNARCGAVRCAATAFQPSQTAQFMEAPTVEVQSFDTAVISLTLNQPAEVCVPACLCLCACVLSSALVCRAAPHS